MYYKDKGMKITNKASNSIIIYFEDILNARQILV